MPPPPLAARTPITLSVWFLTRTVWPTAVPLPNKSLARVAPRTATGAAPRLWFSSNKDPLVVRRSCKTKWAGVVPMIVAFLSAAGATMSALPLNCGEVPISGNPRPLIA